MNNFWKWYAPTLTRLLQQSVFSEVTFSSFSTRSMRETFLLFVLLVPLLHSMEDYLILSILVKHRVLGVRIYLWYNHTAKLTTVTIQTQSRGRLWKPEGICLFQTFSKWWQEQCSPAERITWD